jgi:CRP/FNR family transcriptional regulator, cyclic AMP receptor protein
LSSGTRAATVLPVVAASSAAGDFTRGLSEAARTALFVAGHPRRYARHARVFCEGDHSDFVLVVVEGRLKLVVTTVEGGESVLGIRGPGALVGELAAFHRGPRMATAVALEPLVTRVVAADEFRALVADQPEVGLELIGVLIGRLREADRRRLEFGNYDTLSRVARLLGDLATDQASSASDPREVRLSQAEVAGLVGASRESVARALGLLRTRGLVTTGRGTIMILDSDALLSLAG